MLSQPARRARPHRVHLTQRARLTRPPPSVATASSSSRQPSQHGSLLEVARQRSERNLRQLIIVRAAPSGCCVQIPPLAKTLRGPLLPLFGPLAAGEAR